MELDEQREKVARNAVNYLASLLENKTIGLQEFFILSEFLKTGIEGARTKSDLKRLKQDVKKVYPNLPVFDPGIN